MYKRTPGCASQPKGKIENLRASPGNNYVITGKTLSPVLCQLMVPSRVPCRLQSDISLCTTLFTW